MEECDLTFVWGEYSGFYMLSSDSNPSFSTLRACRRRDNKPDQLFGVGALAHRGLHPHRGVCAGSATGFPRTAPFCPWGLSRSLRHPVDGTDFEQIGGTFFIPDGSKKLPIWLKSFSVKVPRRLLLLLVQGAHPSEAVHMSSSFDPAFSRRLDSLSLIT